MDAAFWIDKWQQGQTGFHAARPNRFLMQHQALLGAGQGRTAYVPLCGKSRDLHALRAMGFSVVGTELSPLATAAFFVEAGQTRTTSQHTTHREHAAGGYRILEGDIFSITAADLGRCDVAYDRAALVAMQPEQRADYVRHLRGALRPGGVLLLVAFAYEQQRMNGPPFSVDAAEVERLWGPHGSVRALGSVELIDEEPRFRERGLSSITEAAYLITLR